MNRANVPEVVKIGNQVIAALHAAVGPFIDAMNEDGSEDDCERKLVGFVLGARAWIGEFAAIEAEVVRGLVLASGLDVARYEDVVRTSEVGGKVVVDAIAARLFEGGLG